MEPSSDAVRSLLTSLFPSGLIEDLAHEREVVQRDRKIDVRMLVWTLVLGFAANGEARSIAGYRRSYELATNQSVAPSSFYDRFSDQLADLLRDLLDHAVEEVAVPHHVAPAFQRFRDVMVADATVFRLHRLLSEFEATHDDQSGAMLYLVHNITDQSVISTEITDERVHESTLFKTGSWLRGRLFLFDQGFFKYRRFALIDENDGFFVSRLKPDANPVITAELREWRGRAIPLEGKQIHDVVGDLSRQYIDVEVEAEFKRGPYNGTRSLDTKAFRVVGVRNEDADDYHLYITNLPREQFRPDEIGFLYRARWEVELLFRELKSQYELTSFETGKAHIVRIQILAALLTLVVSRAILRTICDHADHPVAGVPKERWAATFRSAAQLILHELAAVYSYPPPDLEAFLTQEALNQPASRQTLIGEVSNALSGGLTA
ncbi:IS4 family transposase [Halosimplex aquaticum]|uniref:IS4 family transposase n=1 Tax=Halosimplex aquaticum TaxID=3026162 RepID=A0ABD5YC73_9EURY